MLSALLNGSMQKGKKISKHVLYSENIKPELWAYECYCSGIPLENMSFLGPVENWT